MKVMIICVIAIFVFLWYGIRLKFHKDLDLERTLDERMFRIGIDITGKTILYGRFIISVKQLWQTTPYFTYAICFSKSGKAADLYAYELDEGKFILVQSFPINQIKIKLSGNRGSKVIFCDEVNKPVYSVHIDRKNAALVKLRQFIDKVNEKDI